jgi:uncharacterized protein (UPF0305 family)
MSVEKVDTIFTVIKTRLNEIKNEKDHKKQSEMLESFLEFYIQNQDQITPEKNQLLKQVILNFITAAYLKFGNYNECSYLNWINKFMNE